MHQSDAAIAKQVNLQSDGVVVNQCDTENAVEIPFDNAEGDSCKIKFISTKERGLSKSRNMAIRNSRADLCLIADDDECLDTNYPQTIIKAFQDYPEADVIAFDFTMGGNPQKNYGKEVKKIGYLSALRISSVQIAFRRQLIMEKGICFDEEMGAGTGHGSGEENKFLYDCLRNGLNILFVPEHILSLEERTTSTWFTGYNEKFYLQKGWATERYMGKYYATIFAFYTAIRKYGLYKKNCSFFTALKAMLTGIYCKNSINKN
jgi:glycosyltransferase involved in cell wall biosynthesis